MNTRNKTMAFQAGCRTYSNTDRRENIQPRNITVSISTPTPQVQPFCAEAKEWLAPEQAVSYQKKIYEEYRHEFKDLVEESDGLEELRAFRKKSQ